MISLTITSASADFLTGCAGSAARLLAVDNVLYQVTSVVDAHTVVVHTDGDVARRGHPRAWSKKSRKTLVAEIADVTAPRYSMPNWTR